MGSIKDKELGISIRFIREWKPESEPDVSMNDVALHLAMYPIDDDDLRDFHERFADACQFIRERQRTFH